MGRTMMNTLENVKKIIGEYLDINPDGINETTHLIDDLGLDSLDSIELVMELEEKLQVELSDDEMDNVKTVGELAQALDRVLSRRNT